MGSDSFAGDSPLPAQESAAVLQAVFAVDLWIGLRMGLLDYLRHGMPPARTTDQDFNENYLADRRWVTSYAGRLARVRLLILELASATGCVPQLPARLDFDPLENLRGAGPLDRYRDRLFEACSELTHRLAPDHLPAVESIVRKSRSELLGDRAADGLQADFLVCLDDCMLRLQTLNSVVDQALLAGSAQLDPPVGEPLRREREQLLQVLGQLAAGQPVKLVSPLRLRLEVLELADQAEHDAPAAAESRRRLNRLREPQPRPRPAWLRLYCSLVLHSRSSAPRLLEEVQEPASLCKQLLDQIAAPPRANAPEAAEFRRALGELEELVKNEAPGIPVEQLRRIVGLQDVFQEIIYYLEDDRRYDAGHDYVEADYSTLRAAALSELQRRQRGGSREALDRLPGEGKQKKRGRAREIPSGSGTDQVALQD